MNRSNLRSALLAAALTATPGVVCAQVQTGRTIHVKPRKVRMEKFRGEVLHANTAQITVRSRENERVVRTFTLSPEARDRMQKTIDRGGYQYGDRVEIEHAPGQDVALRIKGRPSKPL